MNEANLGDAFASRGLMRIPVAARMLHLDPRIVEKRVRGQRFWHAGRRYTGIPVDEVARLYSALRPRPLARRRPT